MTSLRADRVVLETKHTHDNYRQYGIGRPRQLVEEKRSEQSFRPWPSEPAARGLLHRNEKWISGGRNVTLIINS